MPKCKFCIPAGEIDFCRSNLTQPDDDEQKVTPGSPVTCGSNTFPGYDFCPEHLSGRGMNLTKMTAEYIANKEK